MWKTKPKLISVAGNSSLPKYSEINRDGYRIGRLKIHDLCIQQDSKHLEFCSINLDFVNQNWYLESLCSSDIVVDNKVVREDQTAILKCNSCIQLPEKIGFIFKCGVTNCQVCETECPEKDEISPSSSSMPSSAMPLSPIPSWSAMHSSLSSPTHTHSELDELKMQFEIENKYWKEQTQQERQKNAELKEERDQLQMELDEYKKENENLKLDLGRTWCTKKGNPERKEKTNPVHQRPRI